ncbi:MAG: TIGR03960 family B12-binding radical SAM protein [Deltaproteobacteria bacterium]|nr:TIGR03960 family B12-binding radical SAM protein [Deltaproteobacteria bacterium]
MSISIPPEARPALLAGLEHPARYLGTESGATPNIIPDAKGRLLTMALAFPDVYEIAHSHLGHKILYHMVNSRAGFRAERVYAPWVDYAQRLESTGRPLRSLESATPIKDFHLIGFSLQYELAYTTILDMLRLGGLNSLASNRENSQPLIVAGGPGASNPEPLADFFDIFFIGDAEASFMEDLEIIKEWRFSKASKNELFDRLAGRPGIYIPSLFKPIYRDGALYSIETLKSGYNHVQRAVATKLSGAPFPLCQITPFVKPVHDRVAVEIGRGCSRGCRFCQAGFLYRPVRERHSSEILKLISQNLESTGHDQAAFLSLSAGDHTQVGDLVESFMDRHAQGQVALSLPSLRVRSLSNHLAQQIKRVRKTGFTMAPEAATERLRAVINKDLTEDDIFQASETAFRLGWRALKLYFMAGLPTETQEDLEAIVGLAIKLSRLSKAKLNLGLAHFTPKAHTPFQWHPASGMDLIEQRLAVVRAAARHPRLVVRFNDPGISFIEGILSRGDRRLGSLLSEVHRLGARFEAWNDHFKLSHWLMAMDHLGMPAQELLTPREPGQVLPWSHLRCGVNEQYLIKELSRAKMGLTTPDCRLSGCQDCGACHSGAYIDLANPKAFEISPQSTHDPIDSPSKLSQNDQSSDQSPNPQGYRQDRRDPKSPKAKASQRPDLGARYVASFAKEGPLVLLGHLEMVELFKKAFRQAKLELRFSQGFHPQPKLSFLTALPLGVESLDERLIFELKNITAPQEVFNALKLPLGLRLISVSMLPPQSPKPKPTAALWEITSPKPVFAEPPFHPRAQLSYTGSKGALRQFDLADFILSIAPKDPYSLHLTIRISPSGTPKPLLAVKAMWGLADDLEVSLKKIATLVS